MCQLRLTIDKKSVADGSLQTHWNEKATVDMVDLPTH